MTRIWLVRHGEIGLNTGRECFTGWTQDALTPRGEEQARATAIRLADEPITSVWCSSLYRSKQTAEVIGAMHGLHPISHKGLNEVNYGEWVGLDRFAVEAGYQDVYHQWRHNAEHVRIPGGETFAEAGVRAHSALDHICREVGKGTTVIVAHKSINRILIGQILGLPVSDYRRIFQSNCAVNLLLKDHGYWVVDCINDDFHVRSLLSTQV